MRNRLTLVILLGIGLLISLRALASPPIAHWQTSNGARVYYIHAPELPMVDIQLVFDAGSARDGRREGLAALTNLMLDKGAGDWDEETIIRRFESLGARYSSDSLRDMASINLRSLSGEEHLKGAVELFSAIVAQPRFDETILERERQQVLIALKAEADDPGDIAERAFYKALYRKHPYASSPIGRSKTVKRIKRKHLVGFHRQYYVARNAVVAIVGDVSRKQARELAEQITAGLPAGEAAPELPQPRPLKKAREVVIEHDSQQSHLLMGYLGMYRGDPDYMALYVGNHILGGGGFGSRILEEIREKRGLSYSAYSYFYPMRVPGPFLMGLQTRNEKLDEAEAVLRQTLHRFIAEGPTAEELKAAKQNITGGFPLRIDSNRDKLAYLAMIGFYKLPLDYLETFNARVQAVTLEQVRDAFARRVNPENLLKVVVGGTGGNGR
jgi:zinc protease